MMISLANTDVKAASTMLQSIEALLDEKDYAARYESYDISCAHFHLALGQPEQISDWLKADFSPYAHPVFFQNYANRVKAQYRYLTQRYSELLAFLKNNWETQRLLIGKTVFKVLEALTLYQLKQREEAVYVLSQAYDFAASNNIIIPFTQYSKDMRTLTAAALKDKKCSIPKPWLENINRKASAYSKRRAYLISEYREINNLDDEEAALTKREIAVIKDLSQGLSRSEIAVSQNISTNTVKMVISTIYDKLYANSLSDIIRTAIERKII
jgi:LuxR family maltose regulon positive regulatory protein